MKELKNILFLSSWYPSENHKTLGNFIQFHAEAVATQNNVYVLFITPKDNLENKIHIENSLINNVNTTIVYFKRGMFKYLSYFNAFKSGLDYLIKENKTEIDCVHMNIIHPAGWQALFLKKRYKLPYIISEHWHGFQDLSIYKIGILRKILIRLVIKNASFLCPVTKHLQNGFESYGYNGNFKIVPNVVNVKRFKPASNYNRTDFTFLHISTLTDKIKNISGILKSFSQLQEHKNIILKIIGDGETEWIINKAKQLNIPDNSIQVEKEKTHEEIALAMQKANVFVLFSNVENLPLVIIEAMACGIPVITSNVGGISEHFDESKGIMIKARDTNALTKSMKEMILNSSHYDSNEIRAYAINKFSNSAIADQFNILYEHAIDNEN